MNKKPVFFKIVTVLPVDARRKVWCKMMNNGIHVNMMVNKLNQLATKMAKKDPKLAKIFASNRNWLKTGIKK